VLQEYFIKFLWASGGAFIALIVAYYTVGKDVSFIKGQLTLVMERLKQIDKLFEAHGNMERTLNDKKHSLDSAHEKIRDLQRKVCNERNIGSKA